MPIAHPPSPAERTEAPLSATSAPLPPLARGRWPGAYGMAFARDPLGTIVALAAAYGDVVRVRALGRTFVVVAHPDAAREVLVTQQRRFVRGYAHRGLRLLLGDGLLTSEGAVHRRHRRLAQPAFHRTRIAGYAATMVAAAERRDAEWRAAANVSAGAAARPLHRDVFAEMMGLTLHIAGETLFGAGLGRDMAATVSTALTDALQAAPLAFLPFGRAALALPVPLARRFRTAQLRLDTVVGGLIAERRRAIAAGEGAGEDLLAMLLTAAAVDEEAGGAAVPALTDVELRDEAMTIFLAGHETTAAALTWTWHLLAAHPAVQARLHAELDAVLGAAPARARPPGFDDLPRLAYTRAVLAEAMRRFPPAYAIGRICAEETTLGGYAVKPGWGVITSPWLAHHDARWWPEPECFRPERWADEAAAAARPRFAYFPFGGGSRLCIGEQFAWTEMTLVLATLAHRWRVERAPDAAPVRPRGAVTLRPAGPVRLTLHPRGTTACPMR